MVWILCCFGLLYRPAAAAPIQPLSWELPYATGVVLKKRERAGLKSCAKLHLLKATNPMILGPSFLTLVYTTLCTMFLLIQPDTPYITLLNLLSNLLPESSFCLCNLNRPQGYCPQVKAFRYQKRLS